MVAAEKYTIALPNAKRKIGLLIRSNVDLDFFFSLLDKNTFTVLYHYTLLWSNNKEARGMYPYGAVARTDNQLFSLAYRMFGPSAGVTTRPELRLKVLQLHEEESSMLRNNQRLLLRFFLHGRHDSIRFSSKPGAEGFLVKFGGNGKHPPRAKRMRGIHGMLRKIFYPKFDIGKHDQEQALPDGL